MSGNKRNLDIVADLRVFIDKMRREGLFLDKQFTRKYYVDLGSSREPASDAMVRCIHDKSLRTLLVRSDGIEQYEREKVGFEEWVWPTVYPLIKGNIGVAQYVLDAASTSKYVLSMMADAVLRPAMCMSFAYGIGHAPADVMEAIPYNDFAAVDYYEDETTIVVTQRLDGESVRCKNARRVIFLGGGLLLSLLLNDYPLGQIDQEIVVYERDKQVMRYAEQILGGKLSDFGIDYRQSDFRTAFEDESQWGHYDLVVMSGIAMYYFEQEEMLFGGAAKLLCDNGVLYFDESTYTEGMKFVALLGWANAGKTEMQMHVEPTVKSAVKLAQYSCSVSNLRFEGYVVPEKSLTNPAGIICVARK